MKARKSKKQQSFAPLTDAQAAIVLVLFVGDSYQFEDSTGIASDPAATQFMIDPRSGIGKEFNQLTDEDCSKIVALGNTCFSMRSFPEIIIDSAVDNGNGATTISFTITNGTGTNSLQLQYSEDGGITWVGDNNYGGSNKSDGTHSTNPIINITAGAVNIRMALTVGGSTYFSNGVLITWTQAPIILGTAAPDGEGGYNYPVTIEDGGVSNAVSLSYSTDGGTTWSIFDGNTNLPDGLSTLNHANPGSFGAVLVKATLTPVGGADVDSNIISVTF